MAEEQEDTYTYEIELYVATRFINSDVKEIISVWHDLGFSDQEWDEMSNYEQEDAASEYLNDWVWQQIDTGWEMVE